MRSIHTTFWCVALSVTLVPRLPAQRDDSSRIQLAALRFFADTTPWHHYGPIGTICISLGTPRPGAAHLTVVQDDQLLVLLAQGPVGPVPLQPGASCTQDPARAFAVVDSASGHPALALVIGPPTILSARVATIAVERVFDGRNGTGYDCTVRKEQDMWVVAICEVTWMS